MVNINRISEKFDKIFGKNRDPGMFYSYTETITPYVSHAVMESCPKCKQQKLISKHYQFVDGRDCLLRTCQNCGFEETARTGDNPGRFDLPTIEECKRK